MNRSGHALGRIHVLWVGYMCVFIKIPYVEVIRVQPFTGWSVGFSAKTVLKNNNNNNKLGFDKKRGRFCVVVRMVVGVVFHEKIVDLRRYLK